jgi:predicted dehydrogenase
MAIAELSPAAQKRANKAYPGIHVTADTMEVITSPDIDAIAVITPVWTHYELAKAALENGKHVFVEKPFTSNVAQGEKLIELATRKNLRIMVDHTFLFTGAVRKISQLLREGTLGKLYYYDSTRVNLGLFQHDINVLWDLAPHDLSIMDYVIDASPEAVVGTGQSHLHDTLLSRKRHCSHQCQLALSGEGANNAHRWGEADAGLERPRGR